MLCHSYVPGNTPAYVNNPAPTCGPARAEKEREAAVQRVRTSKECVQLNTIIGAAAAPILPASRPIELWRGICTDPGQFLVSFSVPAFEKRRFWQSIAFTVSYGEGVAPEPEPGDSVPEPLPGGAFVATVAVEERFLRRGRRRGTGRIPMYARIESWHIDHLGGLHGDTDARPLFAAGYTRIRCGAIVFGGKAIFL